MVSAMTMISRIFGFVRDALVARLFGVDAGTDAFFVAFRIPNLLRRLTAEGAFSQAFVPVLSEYRTQRDLDEVRHLVQHVAGTLLGLLTLITIVGVVAAPLLILIFAPGYIDQQAKFELSVELLRITFPYILFISLSALAGSLLNSFGRFMVPALTPVFLNLSMIGCALWLAPMLETPIMALAWGVFIGGILQLVVQLPSVARLGLLRLPRWGWKDSGVRRVLSLMLPAIFGVSVAQINLLLNTIVASFMVTGSVSWLYYSDRLVELPLAVIGVALATVILPSLSRRHSEGSGEDFARMLDWGVRWVMLVGIPATLGLMLLAGPLLASLFYYGAFTRHDLEMSSYSLVAYSFGLLAFMLVKVLAPGFYARQDTRTPVRFGLVAIAANIVLNVVLVVPMVVYGTTAPHAGLALATALAGYVNAVLLWRGLRSAGVFQAQSGWGRLWMQIVFANGVMAAVLWLAVPDLEQWLSWDGGARVSALLLWVGAAIVVYAASLALVGLRPSALLMKPGRLP